MLTMICIATFMLLTTGFQSTTEARLANDGEPCNYRIDDGKADCRNQNCSENANEDDTCGGCLGKGATCNTTLAAQSKAGCCRGSRCKLNRNNEATCDGCLADGAPCNKTLAILSRAGCCVGSRCLDNVNGAASCGGCLMDGAPCDINRAEQGETDCCGSRGCILSGGSGYCNCLPRSSPCTYSGSPCCAGTYCSNADAAGTIGSCLSTRW